MLLMAYGVDDDELGQFPYPSPVVGPVVHYLYGTNDLLHQPPIPMSL
jgi:hypothetical protein